MTIDINPIAFHIPLPLLGWWPIYWYGISWLVAILLINYAAKYFAPASGDINKKLIDDFVDIPISPENDITEHLFQLITHPGTNQIEDFADGKVKLVSVKAQKNGNLVGHELKVIRQDMPNIDTFVPIIYRKGKPIKAKGSTIIKENDEIYFITAAENIDEVVNEVQEKSERFSRVFIIGGGKIGFNLAKQLENKFNVDHKFQTNVRGVKVRGVYETKEAAERRAKKLQTLDSDFSVFVGQVGFWLPWDPNEDSVEDEHFKNSQLNDIMEKYRSTPPLKIFGDKVKEVIDYNKRVKNPIINVKSNVIQLISEKNYSITLRPSGTEPKVRIMCESFNVSLMNKCIAIVKKTIH